MQDLMNSLANMYERLRKLLGELGIQSALPAFISQQAALQSSRRKRKHMNDAFQRWSDVDKARIEALVSYLVMASGFKSPKNIRFYEKLRKKIAEHPDQHKLQSKKPKLEALSYLVDERIGGTCILERETHTSTHTK
nr:hypothetical protein [Tanacetum cinerariifolium]